MKSNKPLTGDQSKALKKGDYVHKHPNRRQRRHFLHHPPKLNKPVVSRPSDLIPGGHVTLESGSLVRRKPSTLGEQALMALSTVYEFGTRIAVIPYILLKRLWLTVVAIVSRLLGWG